MKETEDKYTKDGTTDLHGNPAIKKETGNLRACPYILANECCERLAYYGMSSNLVNYLKDRLNQGNTSSANSVTSWQGTCYIMPLLGAFLADAYLGRYWTIASFMMIYISGMTLLTMSATVKGLRPSCFNGSVCHPTRAQTAVFYLSIYLVALGTGGIKPCVSSFGADQFDDSDESEKKRKSSFFNWFYFSINIGALVASSVLVWIQINVGWGWGFGVPAVAMAIAVGSFFFGSSLYRHQKPGGSPLTRIAQVLVASLRKNQVKVPADKSLLYENLDEESTIQGSRKLEHTKQFRLLDKAAVETQDDKIKGSVDPWRLCTVTQIEELKTVIRLLPIWASGIIFSTVYSQMSTVFILQGNTLDPHIGPSFKIPSASLSLFDTVSVIFWVPIYDRVIVPVARRFTGHKRGFTQLQRMGIGLVVSIFSMVSAGILELVRLRMVRRGAATMAAMTTRNGKLGWIPDNLNRGHLDYFFCLLAFLSLANFGVHISSLQSGTLTRKAQGLYLMVKLSYACICFTILWLSNLNHLPSLVCISPLQSGTHTRRRQQGLYLQVKFSIFLKVIITI